MLTEALDKLYMDELFEGRSATLVVEALTMRDSPTILLGEGRPRSLPESLSLLMPICFGFEKSFFFFCFSGGSGCAPGLGNTTFAAVVATFGGGGCGEGWFTRNGAGINGGEALPLLREWDSGVGRFCCIAVWAAIRDADTVGTWSEEAVGREGSKKPCEWCLERCLGSSTEGRPDGLLVFGIGKA